MRQSEEASRRRTAVWWRRTSPKTRIADRAGAFATFCAVLLATSLLAVSCTLGPSTRPPLATSGGTSSSASTPSHSATTPVPLGPGGPGHVAPPIVWVACPPPTSNTASDGTSFTVRCAEVTVPLSYQQPRRGHLSLKVAEARGDQTPEDAPPLIVTMGDPGSHNQADIADMAASLPDAIRNSYAIVTVDARGTGFSSGITCVTPSTAAAIVGMSADPATEAGGSQLSTIARQLTFDCGDMVGPALTTINSTNAADDLDVVRAALGIPALSLVASGGSATIGAIYADRYPGRVAAMVLGAPADPLTTPQQHAAASAESAERLFDDFAAACAGFDDGCPLGPDPRRTVSALVERLATSGIDSGNWTMTGGSVLMALTEFLPAKDSWPALAHAIATLDSGNARPLSSLLTTTSDGRTLTATLSGRILYTCNDSSARLSATDMSTAARAARDGAPLFGPFAVGAASLCSAWPTPDEPLGRLSANGAPPIIVIGSTRNPVHPYAEAQAVAGQLTSALLVSWESGSDDIYPGNECVATIVNAYLLRAATPDRGVLCPP
ncbi:MAG: alpha/beta hydrolase [Nakamurella sp.]